MGGYIVHQKDVQLFANQARSEHFRSTLNTDLMPKEDITGGWYHLAAGASNHSDDTVLVPGGCEHNIDNDGDEELVLVYLFCPPPRPRADAGPSPYQPVEE